MHLFDLGCVSLRGRCAKLYFTQLFFQNQSSTIEYFPYFGGTYVAVAASLNGGNCLATFVKMLQEWAVDLGLSINQSKIWEKTIALGQNASEEDLVVVNPTLFGERHDPNLRGMVSNITTHNLGLGQVTRSICKGIAKNLAEMMPPQLLTDEAGLTRIIGSGACLSRNPVLMQEVQNIYQMPVEFTSEGSACIGAALEAIDVHFKR